MFIWLEHWRGIRCTRMHAIGNFKIQEKTVYFSV